MDWKRSAEWVCVCRRGCLSFMDTAQGDECIHYRTLSSVANSSILWTPRWEQLHYLYGCTEFSNCKQSGDTGSATVTDDVITPYGGQPRSIFTFGCCSDRVHIAGNEETGAAAKHAPDSPEVDAIDIQPAHAKVAARTTIINAWQQMLHARHSKLPSGKQSVRHCKWGVSQSSLTGLHHTNSIANGAHELDVFLPPSRTQMTRMHSWRTTYGDGDQCNSTDIRSKRQPERGPRMWTVSYRQNSTVPNAASLLYRDCVCLLYTSRCV